ncbi:MAG: metallophosphoesterase family protein [Pseudomonadota bacterium]
MVFDLLARSLRGKLPEGEVPEGTRVYAVGDIHGCLAQLERLHEMIRADAAQSSAERLVAVYVGDYIDRGPDCRGVVEHLLSAPLPGFETVYLRGNHEDFLLEFLEDPRRMSGWMMNGAASTLSSYGVSLSASAASEVRSELRFNMPESHVAFYQSLVLWHLEGDYLFVHAGILPGVPIEEQEPKDLMWIRERFLDSNQDHGKIVVHGHTPIEEPELRFNRIGIDTGAVYGGQLTALVLEADSQRFLQA